MKWHLVAQHVQISHLALCISSIPARIWSWHGGIGFFSVASGCSLFQLAFGGFTFVHLLGSLGCHYPFFIHHSSQKLATKATEH